MNSARHKTNKLNINQGLISMKKTKSIILGIAALFLTFSAFAGFWDWSTPYRGPDQDIITLVITGNYAKSRLLADIIQDETKQPYILLPAGGKGKIFFCPARNKPSLEILESDLERFMKFVNPQQIIVLGDTSYVPEKYLKMIDPDQTVIVVKNRNWNQAAKRLGKLLDATNLSYDFKRLSGELESGQLYKPTTMNGKPQAQPVIIGEQETIIETGDGAAIEKDEVIIEPAPEKDLGKDAAVEPEAKTGVAIPEEPVLIEDKSVK
jgi:hypothetical protein